uniref:EF-hand domain-containing protein n=1 Tax=Macrostomum lignano TaxID=282301 RepID=A0A1I8IWC5_9PLAT
MRACCGQQQQQQLVEEVFRRLDTDMDGRINLDDFQLALTAISCQAADDEPEDDQSEQAEAEADKLPTIDGAEELPCSEEVQKMQRLLAEKYPQLARRLPATVATELARQRREREELETSLRRSRELAQQRTRQLQEEMERQLAGFERQARAKERQRLQAEFQQLEARQQEE